MHTVFVRQNPFSTEFEVLVTNGNVVNQRGMAYSYEVEDPYQNGVWSLTLRHFSLKDADDHLVPVTERALKVADDWAELFKRAGIKAKVANELYHDHYEPPPEVLGKHKRKKRRDSEE